MDKVFYKKGILFDLDGTLLESMGVWADIDRRFLGKRNLAVPEDYMDKTAVMDFYHAALYTIERFNLDEKPEDIIEEWKQIAVNEYTYNVKPKPFAKEYLEKVKKEGLIIAVVTSSDKAVYTAALKANGMEKYFDEIISASGTPMRKDDGGIYRYALDKLNLKAEDAILFEDAYGAVVGGKSVGLTVVAVKTPWTNVGIEQYLKTADMVIEDYSYAPTVLKKE